MRTVKGFFVVTLMLAVLFYAVTPTYAAAYEYDDIGRLIKVIYDTGDTVIYSYDAMGNITVLTVNSNSASAVPVITTASGQLLPGVVGKYYSVLISSDNAPISFRITKGNLPDGLSLSNNGVISGTPVKTETSYFSVTAANSAGVSLEVNFSIYIGNSTDNLSGGRDDNQNNQNDNQGNNSSQSNGNSTEPKLSPTQGNDIISQLQQGKNPAINIEGSEKRITLSGSELLAIFEANKTLSINTGIASLVITSENIAEMNLEADGDVIIDFFLMAEPVSISQGDKVNESILKQYYNITVTINGKRWEEFNLPLTIRFNLSEFNLSDSQKSKITGVRYLEKNEYNQLGGGFVDGDVFEFKTSSLSVYGVLISDTLVSIVTAIDILTYTVNGNTKTTDVAPMIKDDRTMVPIRFIAEAFGAQVDWIESSRSVIINLDEKTIELMIGVKSQGMDVAPEIIGDRTMVPLRYISEQFNTNVVWDAENRSIYLYR